MVEMYSFVTVHWRWNGQYLVLFSFFCCSLIYFPLDALPGVAHFRGAWLAASLEDLPDRHSVEIFCEGKLCSFLFQEFKSISLNEAAKSSSQHQLTLEKWWGATKPLASGLICAVALLQLLFIHVVICLLGYDPGLALSGNLPSSIASSVDTWRKTGIFSNLFSLRRWLTNNMQRNLGSLWNMVFCDIQISCLTSDQHRFRKCFVDFHKHMGDVHKKQQLNNACCGKDAGKMELN